MHISDIKRNRLGMKMARASETCWGAHGPPHDKENVSSELKRLEQKHDPLLWSERRLHHSSCYSTVVSQRLK